MIKEYILQNGVKLIYSKREGDLTSFCIGFDAGALVEEERNLGVAHAVEHMIFKGTKDKSEYEINRACDEVFGFHNAMTNYPYAIYYGTTLSSDFEKGFSLYSDIVLNPIFPEEGFSEEISIILEELKEWKDDPYQVVEDEMLFNSFKERRIKELIIGTEGSITSITLEDIKNFYNKYYNAKNSVISVVSSLDYEDVLKIVNKYFEGFKGNKIEDKVIYESNNSGIFIKEQKGLKGAKIQYCFPIHMLTERELKVLNLFNLSFGDGTSSLLYDEIRTKNGLAYEISSSVKNEKGIKLFTITMGTSNENIDKAIMLINNQIELIKNSKGRFSKENIKKLAKTFRLKKELSLERSIELSKKLTTYSIMYGSYKALYEETEALISITEEETLKVINKVLVNPTIQVLKSI